MLQVMRGIVRAGVVHTEEPLPGLEGRHVIVVLLEADDQETQITALVPERVRAPQRSVLQGRGSGVRAAASARAGPLHLLRTHAHLLRLFSLFWLVSLALTCIILGVDWVSHYQRGSGLAVRATGFAPIAVVAVLAVTSLLASFAMERREHRAFVACGLALASLWSALVLTPFVVLALRNLWRAEVGKAFLARAHGTDSNSS